MTTLQHLTKSASTLLAVSDYQFSDIPEQRRLLGDALGTYVYWYYRTLGCPTTQSREASWNVTALFRSGDLGGELGCDLQMILSQAKSDILR